MKTKQRSEFTERAEVLRVKGAETMPRIAKIVKDCKSPIFEVKKEDSCALEFALWNLRIKFRTEIALTQAGPEGAIVCYWAVDDKEKDQRELCRLNLTPDKLPIQVGDLSKFVGDALDSAFGGQGKKAIVLVPPPLVPT